MLGLRCSFTRPQQSATLLEGRLDWLWEEAEKAGMPIMVAVPHSNLHAIDTVARRFPGLKIAIDHLGIPKGKKDDAAFRDLDKLLALAMRPNINVKATALPDFTEGAYPYRRLHPYLRRVHDAFGAKRIFWGSDLSRPRCSNYAQAVTMFTEEMPWLTAEDREWIMGRALCEWLGWDL
jgi:L-fuconolactonase